MLRAHGQAEGRDYDEIEKTSMFHSDLGENGENVGKTIGRLRQLSKLGIQTAIGSVKEAWRITPLEIIGEKVIPAVAEF